MQSKDEVFSGRIRLGVAAALALGCVGALGYEAIAEQAPDGFDAVLGAVAMTSLRALNIGDLDLGGMLPGKKSA